MVRRRVVPCFLLSGGGQRSLCVELEAVAPFDHRKGGWRELVASTVLQYYLQVGHRLRSSDDLCSELLNQISNALDNCLIFQVLVSDFEHISAPVAPV